MKKEYLSDPNYTFEKMNHASKACGPLVQWAIAQVGYADVLKRVDPLRAELKVLENQAEETKLKVTIKLKFVSYVNTCYCRVKRLTR